MVFLLRLELEKGYFQLFGVSEFNRNCESYETVTFDFQRLRKKLFFGPVSSKSSNENKFMGNKVSEDWKFIDSLNN